MKERRFFQQWVDATKDPKWGLLPLTHITKAIRARDILIDGSLNPAFCDIQKEKLVYTFYGRVGFRVTGEDIISVERLCPVCIVLKGDIINSKAKIFPFDTGAYHSRFYEHQIDDEFNLDDFSISGDATRLNRLIARIYPNKKSYMVGDTSNVSDPDEISRKSEFEVQAYMDLIQSFGRNEPDDRVSAMEVAFSDPISLKDVALCVIVPHTLIETGNSGHWLNSLGGDVPVLPYEFLPRRRPEFYHTAIEKIFLNFCRDNGFLDGK